VEKLIPELEIFKGPFLYLIKEGLFNNDKVLRSVEFFAFFKIFFIGKIFKD
jgi:hypothetical protein